MNELAIIEVLERDCHVDKVNPLLVGFSGGPDSLCLLHILKKTGFSLLAAHLDHGLRGTSAEEAKQAHMICDQMGIAFITCRVDVRDYMLKNKLSLEEGARHLRYEFLFRSAAEHHAQAVVVAHHADDQVETVLMHLLRGSGLSGLAGMQPYSLPNPWSETIPLIRPLLTTSRDEILAYLKDNDLTPIYDESNADIRFFRNRIRKELIPVLSTFNPQIKERISRMANVLSADEDFLVHQAELAWQTTVSEENDEFLILDRTKLSRLHPGMVRRLVRKAIARLEPDLRDIDFEVIDRTARFCLQPNQARRIDLLAGLECFLFLKDKIVFAHAGDPLNGLWPQVTSRGRASLTCPMTKPLNGSWIFSSRIVDHYLHRPDPFIAQLDADKLTGSLSLGVAEQGDRFAPFGMKGKMVKLGNFWTNSGLPVRARHSWPLVRSGEEIIWVPGFRIAEGFQVDPNTQHVLYLTISKEPV